MPDGVPLSVVSDAIRVVTVCRSVRIAQTTTGAGTGAETARHTGRGPVVASPPNLVLCVDENGTNGATGAVSACGYGLRQGQEVRLPVWPVGCAQLGLLVSVLVGFQGLSLVA